MAGEGVHRLRRLPVQMRYRLHLVDLAVAVGTGVIGFVLIQELWQPGFPPGVDTPLYLHLSWFTQEALQGSQTGWLDPYWYGGFRPFTTYPPVTYGLVGGLAALPGVGLAVAYKGVLLLAYVGTGVATIVLARELGSSRVWGGLAGILVILAHPLLAAIGLWGWLASIAAMPFVLLAWAGLERAYHRHESRYGIWGGAALGIAVLTHHMTAFAFALGLPAWGLFYFVRYPAARRHLVGVSLRFTGAAMLLSIWWIVPWLINLLDAGFQREIPGLWSFPLVQYLDAVSNTGLIAEYAFPSYLGLSLITLGIGGAVHALVAPSRYTPYAILLLILLALSLGEQVNPLLRVRPFDGLDVARFHLFMVPVIVIVGLPFLASVGEGIGGLVVLGQMTRDATVASDKLFQPYRVSESMSEAIAWFAQEGHEGKVLGVGFWHWDDFLLPYLAGRSVVDGWHDEGTESWRTMRPLRRMMWTREVDAPEAHRLMGELDGRYIAIDNCYPGEGPAQFRQALAGQPELFQRVAEFRSPLEECSELLPRVSRSMERFLAEFSDSYPQEKERMITIFQRVPAGV